jgi:hypothetical protein
MNGSTSFILTKTSSDHKRTFIVDGEEQVNPAGINAASNEFIPKLEYVDTQIRLEDVSQYKDKDKNPIGQTNRTLNYAYDVVEPLYTQQVGGSSPSAPTKI